MFQVLVILSCLIFICSGQSDVYQFNGDSNSDCMSKNGNQLCMVAVPKDIKLRIDKKLRSNEILMGLSRDTLKTTQTLSRCDLCEHSLKTSFEPTVVNVRNRKKYVVQTSKIAQVLQVVECKHPDDQKESACVRAKELRSMELSVNTTMECRQAYTKMTLTLFNAKTDTFESLDVNYKSGCVCDMKYS